MVKALHRAGIEVILDVVYNHTAEGNHLGPMLSFKGIDNAVLLPLLARRPALLHGLHGHRQQPQPAAPERAAADHGQRCATGSLEMHVDGFRFDLASALAREFYEVDRLSAFFDIIHQDPVLSQVKLIAEPWDVGPGGYQVGNFPVLWTEWNGIYRDDDARLLARPGRRRRRASPRGSPGRATSTRTTAAGRSRRSTSSPRTTASRCADLVSYNDKHNEANLEDNRDGTDDNRSWNCGVEGPTDDPEIVALRAAPAAQLPDHAAALAGRADAARRRRDGPHPARQQQRLLPGQRDQLVRLGPRRATSARCSTSPGG